MYRDKALYNYARYFTYLLVLYVFAYFVIKPVHWSLKAFGLGLDPLVPGNEAERTKNIHTGCIDALKPRRTRYGNSCVSGSGRPAEHSVECSVTPRLSNTYSNSNMQTCIRSNVSQVRVRFIVCLSVRPSVRHSRE